jgi:hypothetical protein
MPLPRYLGGLAVGLMLAALGLQIATMFKPWLMASMQPPSSTQRVYTTVGLYEMCTYSDDPTPLGFSVDADVCTDLVQMMNSDDLQDKPYCSDGADHPTNAEAAAYIQWAQWLAIATAASHGLVLLLCFVVVWWHRHPTMVKIRWVPGLVAIIPTGTSMATYFSFDQTSHICSETYCGQYEHQNFGNDPTCSSGVGMTLQLVCVAATALAGVGWLVYGCCSRRAERQRTDTESLVQQSAAAEHIRVPAKYTYGTTTV